MLFRPGQSGNNELKSEKKENGKLILLQFNKNPRNFELTFWSPQEKAVQSISSPHFSSLYRDLERKEKLPGQPL
jgi:hypothetical protein